MTPSERAKDWATRLVAGWDLHDTNGVPTVLGGDMCDPDTDKMAADLARWFDAFAADAEKTIQTLRGALADIASDLCTGTGGPRNDEWTCLAEKGVNGYCHACLAKKALIETAPKREGADAGVTGPGTVPAPKGE